MCAVELIKRKSASVISVKNGKAKVFNALNRMPANELKSMSSQKLSVDDISLESDNKILANTFFPPDKEKFTFFLKTKEKLAINLKLFL